MPKRETNAQRVAREDEHRITELVAGVLATTICKKGHVPLPADELIRNIKRVKGKLLVVVRPVATYFLGDPRDEVHLPETGSESECLRKTYAAIGRELCEFKGNVSEFLRLVADKIEGKQAYSPGEDWYDDAIQRAYLVACQRRFEHCPDLDASTPVVPTFSDFKKVFREQNPKSKVLSEDADREEQRSLQRKGYRCYTERSLRRSLKRLGCSLGPDKRGRPKEK